MSLQFLHFGLQEILSDVFFAFTITSPYYIVGSNDSNEDHIIRAYYDNQSINPLEGIKIDIVSDSLIVGLAATKLEEYDRDLWGTISQYLGNTGSCLNN